MIEEIVFSSDTRQRKEWFTGISFGHPAKMHLSLQIYLIERYTKPGDTILDPMFGSGTLLVACALGRNVIGIELEQKFVDMAKANWNKIKPLGAMLGCTMGTATILQGDSRQLPEVLADVICTSPPYSETSQRGGDSNKDWSEIIPKLGSKHGCKWNGYSQLKENIGNLKSQNYLEAMLQVYRGCYHILKDKGLLILVTKNFIRNKKIIDLAADTILLCEQVGFTMKERLKRKLTAQSFWRIIALSKCDNRKAKGKCKLGLECPMKKDKQFDIVWSVYAQKEENPYEKSIQIIEKLCAKFINTMPKIEFEDCLIFQKGM